MKVIKKPWHNHSYFILPIAYIIIVFLGCAYDVQPLSDKFSDIQKNTLTPYCTASGCHTGDLSNSIPPAAQLSLEPDSAYNQLLYNHPIQNFVAAGKYRALVVPFKPDSSYLLFKLTLAVTNDSDGAYMPNNNTGHIPQAQIDAITSWIKKGAPND
jgi:hypothetical protein